MYPYVLGVCIPTLMFLSIMRTADYPFFSLEAIYSGVVIVVSGLLFGAVLRVFPLKVRIVVYAVLSALAVGVLFRPFPELPLLGRLSGVVTPLIIAVGGTVLLLIIRESAEGLLSSVFVAMCLGAVFIVPLPDLWNFEETLFSEGGNEELPPYVHIVLDEHIGLEKIPSSVKNAEIIKNRIKKFYLEQDFLLYGNVFVKHSHTIASFSRFLNLERRYEEESSRIDFSRKKSPELANNNRLTDKNELFQVLNNVGYKTTVVRSSYLDLCSPSGDQGSVSKCNVYPLSPLLDSLKYSNLPVSIKVKLIINEMFRRSGVEAVMNRIARSRMGQDLSIPLWPVRVCMNCISSTTMLNKVKDELPRLGRGNALFIHLITPHSPFQYYDDQCQPTYPQKYNSGTPKNYFNIYLGQLGCAQHEIFDFIDELVKSDVGKSAIVVVHGDHGLRHESLNIPVEKLDLQKMQEGNYPGQAAHSTFLAIRDPGHLRSEGESPYKKDLKSLSRLLRGESQRMFGEFDK